jgi:hypothetical protein
MSTSAYTGLNLFNFIQSVYELHCDQVQLFVGMFQQIAAAQNRCIYCLLERRIQQQKHVPQLKEQQRVKLN